MKGPGSGSDSGLDSVCALRIAMLAPFRREDDADVRYRKRTPGTKTAAACEYSVEWWPYCVHIIPAFTVAPDPHSSQMPLSLSGGGR